MGWVQTEKDELKKKLETEKSKYEVGEEGKKVSLVKLMKVQIERDDLKRKLKAANYRYEKLEGKYAQKLSDSVILNHKVKRLDEENKYLRRKVRKNKRKNKSDDEEPN